MTNFTLPKVVADAIAADVSATERSAKLRHRTIDILVANKYRAIDFISPKGKDKVPGTNCGTADTFDALKRATEAGFAEADRALLAITSPAAVAALKPEKAARRTYVQQQVGSRMKDFKNALLRRESTAEKGGAGTGKRPAQDRFMDHLSKAANVLREESDFTFDLVAMLALLEKATALAKTK